MSSGEAVGNAPEASRLPGEGGAMLTAETTHSLRGGCFEGTLSPQTTVACLQHVHLAAAVRQRPQKNRHKTYGWKQLGQHMLTYQERRDYSPLSKSRAFDKKCRNHWLSIRKKDENHLDTHTHTHTHTRSDGLKLTSARKKYLFHSF